MDSLLRLALCAALLCSCTAFCSAPARAQDGAALFKSYGAICHEAGASKDLRAPGSVVLARLTPEQILQALERRAMKTQTAARRRARRRALAEYLSGRPLSGDFPNLIPEPAFCA